ncbi:MAG: signal peptidase II [Gammaproteobacteria bacterium]
MSKTKGIDAIRRFVGIGKNHLRHFDAERFVIPGHPPVRWLLLGLLILVADQFSKLLVLYYVQPYERIHVLPVLNITLIVNKGAAFSMFAGANGWQQWLFVVLALVFAAAILVWLRRLPARGQAWLAAGLSLILGGALGNAVDRVWHAHVIDFIQVHWHTAWYFPTFNLADSAITVGAIIAIADALFHRRPAKDAETDQPAE